MMMPVCKRCGEPIIGNYVEALSATWHPEHFVCAACGRPFEQARFIVHGNGDPYHEACYTERILPRCAYCNKPLAGEYLIDAWGTKYCKEHEQQYPACEFCGRLIPPAQQERGTDITSCAICRSSAIESAEVAKPLYAQVVRWVSGQGLRYNQMRLQLELCNRQRLAQLLQARSLPHALGATNSVSYSRNGQVVSTEVQGIAVRLGLPAVLFQGTAVHELGHVWLIVQGINGLGKLGGRGILPVASLSLLSRDAHDRVSVLRRSYRQRS